MAAVSPNAIYENSMGHSIELVPNGFVARFHLYWSSRCLFAKSKLSSVSVL